MFKRYIPIILALSLVLLLSGCGKTGTVVDGAGKIENVAPDFRCVPLQQNHSCITISFTGDMNMASEVRTGNLGFNNFAEQMGRDYFLKNVAPVFRTDSLTIVDVENVFTDRPLGRIDKGDEGYAYWYKSPSVNAQVLSSSGVEIGSIANNHTMDFGTDGYEDTKEALTAVGVQWGDDDNPIYTEVNGIRFGILCCKMFNAGQFQNIMQWLARAVETTDYQIVYFHGGTERIFTPDAWKVNYCHQMVDAGADLVVGDHPHVLQPYESYQGADIVYSLGNFLFGGSRTCEYETAIFQKRLYVSDQGIIDSDHQIIPCFCYLDTTEQPYQPAILPDGAEKQQILDFMYGRADTPEYKGTP